MNYQDFKEWFLSEYEADEIVELLQIEATELLDRFEDSVLDYWKEQQGGECYE